MQKVPADLAHFVTIYIDDVLVRSNDESSMVDYIERLLDSYQTESENLPQ